ncbi:hypothetical protein KEM52_002810 [Ascosphaera acerosa]|nr:hypothetical protein KEM52_002810 [Ascosphaera acerosa]
MRPVIRIGTRVHTRNGCLRSTSICRPGDVLLRTPATRPCLAGHDIIADGAATPSSAPSRGLVTEALTSLLQHNVNAAHELLLGIHAHSHLPWALSIPLTAVVVRCTVALPLQVWSLAQRDKMLRLRPLLTAKRWFRRKLILDEANASKTVLTPAEVDHAIRRDLRADTRAIYRRMGVFRASRYATLAQLPVWLAVMEALRRMVGAEGGLLSILHRLMNPAGDVGREFLVPVADSMAAEGALWFPDLLVADPHMVLPVLLSAAMYTNITWGWKVATDEQLARMPRGAQLRARVVRGLRAALQLVALGLAPTTIASGVPSGLLLYWISSTTFATLQTRAFARFWPPPDVPAQCANFGVAPAASSDAAAAFRVLPVLPEAEEVIAAAQPASKPAKPRKTQRQRQVKRYIKQ